MNKVKLGHTGLEVSRLCFGSLALSPLQREISPEEAGEILLTSFRLGINFVDTAQYYRNYAQIAAGLSRFDGEVVIASKTYAYTREMARDAVEEARAALGRDVIDIFLLHEQESEHTLRGHAPALEYLYDCKARGIVRAVGISTHHAAGVTAAARAGLDVVHPLINIAGIGIADGSREDMERAITAAREAGLGVYAMKALGGGHLHASAAEALTYALAWGDSLALGMRSADEVRADIAFVETGKFPDVPSLSRAARSLYVEEHCTGCGACLPACKSGALTVKNGRAVCDASRCVLCGYCGGRCADFCLKII